MGMRSERFQEAFERFEKVVDISQFESYRELWYAFRQWGGKRWRNTEPQNRALAYEGEQLSLPDIAMPRAFGHTVEETKKIMAYRGAKVRREKWVTTYRKTVKRRVKVVAKKYKGIGEVRIKALSWYVSRGYSANKIQKRLKDRGLGIQRKKLLNIVREIRLKEKKADSKKYTPKKYRRKKMKDIGYPPPKYVYEKIQLEALPIESWRHLNYTAKRINRLLWIKHHIPETKEKLLFMFRLVSGRSVHTDIQYLIDIGFLKEENGKLHLTEKGNNYIEQAVKFVRDYLRREKREDIKEK